MRGEFVEVDGARLYYYATGTRGAGEPILLLHGFPTSSHLWSQLAPLLPAGHRIVVVDLLGFGRSDPAPEADLSITAQVTRTLGLLDALGIRTASIVGHGTGCSVAMGMAMQAPTRVSRLCLVNPIASGSLPGISALAARWLAPLLRYLSPAITASAIRSRLLRGYDVPDRGSHSIDLYLRRFTSVAGRQTLMAHVAACESAGTTHKVRRDSPLPTAVVRGTDDPFAASSVAEELCAAIPGATLEVIEGARHFIPEENPQIIARVVTGLLSR